MRVAFRTDASVEIGSGHVMRCLTLADALRKNNVECLFLCRKHEGHLLQLVADRGHRAIALPHRDAGGAFASRSPLRAYAHWLGTDWTTDAEDSRKMLADIPMDWLVVDHYALDRRWEQAMRGSGRRLLVIDDLADRPHDCDLLLDQNLGRHADDYFDLLPPGVQTLIGPRYALLRPEFPHLRAESLARRERPEFKHLLVTMGGVDKDNATGAILDALCRCNLPHDLRTTVVMGSHAPFLPQVMAKAASMPQPPRVLVGVSDMARLMTDADLAIGAAGSTSWERCCLGVPTIQLVLAENQKKAAEALWKAKAAIFVEHPLDVTGLLQERFLSATVLEHLEALSLAAAQITDGLGTSRVLRDMVRHYD